MTTTGLWVLEVVKYIENTEESLIKGGRFEHVGYMKAKFRAKKDACSYYDKNNPHMRSLNAHGTYKSDWDPITNLAYIVRKDYGLSDTIEPFNLSEIPKDSGITRTYEYLK